MANFRLRVKMHYIMWQNTTSAERQNNTCDHWSNIFPLEWFCTFFFSLSDANTNTSWLQCCCMEAFSLWLSDVISCAGRQISCKKQWNFLLTHLKSFYFSKALPFLVFLIRCLYLITEKKFSVLVKFYDDHMSMLHTWRELMFHELKWNRNE